MAAITELGKVYEHNLKMILTKLFKQYIGRETPLYLRRT